MRSSESSEEGFRSRQDEAKKRHQIRSKILKDYKVRVVQTPAQDPSYKGLSMPLVKGDSSGQSMDMFAEEYQSKVVDRSKSTALTDEAGYYNVVTGTIVAAKWRILQKIGKGVFGVVVRAQATEQNEVKCPKYVALKIIRRNPLMQASGEKEYKIMREFEGSRNVVCVYDYFHQHNHLFIVCELMGLDLRTFTHRHQSRITLAMVREFAIGMFMSLHQLRKRQIIHADIKPDNFLYSQDCSKVKLSDFGTAYKVHEHNADVDQLVARYYRPPQVILGRHLPKKWLYGIDTWGVGCSLFELYTGRFLFEGQNNEEMLRMMIEIKGNFSLKVLKGSKYAEKYFNEEGYFLGKKVGGRDLLAMVGKEEDQASNFKDLLDKCLMLNAAHRITPQQAFQHPFISYQIKLQ